MSEAVTQICSGKKVFLEISQNSQESACSRIAYLIKFQTSGNFIKQRALAQLFMNLQNIYEPFFYRTHVAVTFRVRFH